MSEDKVSFVIAQEDHKKHKRLDTFIHEKLPELSRSLIKKIFEDGHITASIKLSLKKLPAINTQVDVLLPVANETNIIPENIPLEIIFEDQHLIIINKQAGIVTHPAPGNYTGTLVNAILHHCPDLKGIGNEKRPGIVHRLDKGTSGVMVIAKSQKAHTGLIELFSEHNIDREYEAIVLGARIESKQTINSLIGRSPHNRLKMSTRVTNGKEATTHIEVIEYFKNFTHVKCTLETGRTHQIRVHLSEMLNCPIINDELYGRAKEELHRRSDKMKVLLKDYEHPFLHARLLGFVHPITKEKLLFESAPPQVFQDVLKALKEEK